MNSNIFSKVDWLLIITYLLLSAIGFISIYSVQSGSEGFNFAFSEGYIKQLLWITIGITAGFSILLIDSGFFKAIAYPLYIFTLLLILGAGIWGVAVSGTQGWINLGFFRLQPSEFGKLVTALALAKFLTTYDVKLSNFRDQLIAFLLIFVPVGFVLLQGDVGTSMTYAAFGLVLYRQGMHPFFLYFPLWLGALFVATLLFDEVMVAISLGAVAVLATALTRLKRKWILSITGMLVLSVIFVFAVDYTFENILQHHHKQRINVLLGKEIDLRGAGYNVHQSLIAIGSGGISGQGLNQGTQTQYNFIPEQNTDFIFTAIAEEFGFVGSAVLLLLYLLLMLRIIHLAENQNDRFARIFGYGMVSLLFFHFTINLAMTMGLFPVVGIPLPYISYGGSSFIAFSLMLFIYLRMIAQAQEIQY